MVNIRWWPFFVVLVAAIPRGGLAAETARPARLLVVTVTTGFRHASINTAEPVLEELGRSSGLFHVDFLRLPPGRPQQPKAPQRGKDVGDDDWKKQEDTFKAEQQRFREADVVWQNALEEQFAKVFAPESLATFDGIIFASTTGELPLLSRLDQVGQGVYRISCGHRHPEEFRRLHRDGRWLFCGPPVERRWRTRLRRA